MMLDPWSRRAVRASITILRWTRRAGWWRWPQALFQPISDAGAGPKEHFAFPDGKPASCAPGLTEQPADGIQRGFDVGVNAGIGDIELCQIFCLHLVRAK